MCVWRRISTLLQTPRRNFGEWYGVSSGVPLLCTIGQFRNWCTGFTATTDNIHVRTFSTLQYNYRLSVCSLIQKTAYVCPQAYLSNQWYELSNFLSMLSTAVALSSSGDNAIHHVLLHCVTKMTSM